MAGFNELSSRRQVAILALLQQPTVTEAAQAAGCGERTLFRWLQDPAFEQAYRAARREVINQAMARLQHLTSEAVTALHAVLNDPESSSSAIVSAAKLILDLAVKEDFENRLTAIEKRVLELDLKKGGIEAWRRTAAADIEQGEE